MPPPPRPRPAPHLTAPPRLDLRSESLPLLVRPMRSLMSRVTIRPRSTRASRSAVASTQPIPTLRGASTSPRALVPSVHRVPMVCPDRAQLALLPDGVAAAAAAVAACGARCCTCRRPKIRHCSLLHSLARCSFASGPDGQTRAHALAIACVLDLVSRSCARHQHKRRRTHTPGLHRTTHS
jgi:hypothetical protein